MTSPAPHAPDAPFTIRHDSARQRFETTVDGHVCVADYRMSGDVMVMTHTGVPSAVGGRGIAAALVKAALAWAREHRLRVDPACSYVHTYMRRHPDTQDLLAR